MKKNILAFGASTSSKSINQAFATWAASCLDEFETEVICLKDYEMPLFSVDVEAEAGDPPAAKELHMRIKNSDGIIISLAEHNGAYSAAFKNAFDWLSRLEGKAWDNKPLLLLSTSPGGRGGASVMEIACKRFPFNGGEVIATFSLPSFKENFSSGQGILDEKLRADFSGALEAFRKHLVAPVQEA